MGGFKTAWITSGSLESGYPDFGGVEMIGDVSFAGGVMYVQVNEGGTLMKLGKPQWWRVLTLFILRAFGGRKHPVEVFEHLFPNRAWSIY